MQHLRLFINPLSNNITKWSNTLTQFVGKLPTNCLGVFDHFVGLALEELRLGISEVYERRWTSHHYCYRVDALYNFFISFWVPVNRLRAKACSIPNWATLLSTSKSVEKRRWNCGQVNNICLRIFLSHRHTLIVFAHI